MLFVADANEDSLLVEQTLGVFDNLLDAAASSSGKNLCVTALASPGVKRADLQGPARSILTLEGPGGGCGMGSGMDLSLERPAEHGVCGALHNVGFSQLSFMVASSFVAASNTGHLSYDEDVFFESAWRAQAWNQACVPPKPGPRTGYHANVFSALKGLASVQRERSQTYTDVEKAVRHSIALARKTALDDFKDDHDSQSTKNRQSQLVRLQMCEDIECFLQELLKPNHPSLSSPSSSQGRSAFAPSVRSDSGPVSHMSALKALRNIWHCRYRQIDSNFPLCEPLISLHTILLSLSAYPQLLEDHLCLAAKVSMKQGNMSFARCSMQKLWMWTASHKDGRGEGEPSSWWIRAAKVLVCHLYSFVFGYGCIHMCAGIPTSPMIPNQASTLVA